MFKKLKQKLEEGADKVAKQVTAASNSVADQKPSEGVLVDFDAPDNSSTPNKPSLPTVPVAYCS